MEIRYTSVGTVTTTSGLVATNPVIVAEIRFEIEHNVSVDFFGYASLEEYEDVIKGERIHFRIGERSVLSQITVDITTLDSESVGEDVGHILYRIAKSYLESSLGVVLTYNS